jgi:hypothetical protein
MRSTSGRHLTTTSSPIAKENGVVEYWSVGVLGLRKTACLAPLAPSVLLPTLTPGPAPTGSTGVSGKRRTRELSRPNTPFVPTGFRSPQYSSTPILITPVHPCRNEWSSNVFFVKPGDVSRPQYSITPIFLLHHSSPFNFLTFHDRS